jgi:hypothetical protein
MRSYEANIPADNTGVVAVENTTKGSESSHEDARKLVLSTSLGADARPTRNVASRHDDRVWDRVWGVSNAEVKVGSWRGGADEKVAGDQRWAPRKGF